MFWTSQETSSEYDYQVDPLCRLYKHIKHVIYYIYKIYHSQSGRIAMILS